MQLDELRQAAKRLRKQSASLVEALAQPVTHAQALDLVAQLHGFRHYHEAQQFSKNTELAPDAPLALTMRQKAQKLLATSGGLFPIQGTIESLSELAWEPGEVLAIESPTGRGKTALTLEFVCQALAQGRRVRIWDSFREYRNLTQKLGGVYLGGSSGEDPVKAWSSDNPLVAIYGNCMTYYDDYAPLLLKLAEVSDGTVFVCEELLQGTVLPEINARIIRTRYTHSLQRSLTVVGKYTLKYVEGSRDHWKLLGAGDKEENVFRHMLTKKRYAALFTQE